MLTNGLKATNNDFDATYGSIHNYYEKLVFEAILQDKRAKTLDHNLQSDVACLALNNLPSKYVRYDVDMVFYLTGEEHQAMRDSVNEAINNAINYIELRVKVKEHGLTEEV